LAVVVLPAVLSLVGRLLLLGVLELPVVAVPLGVLLAELLVLVLLLDLLPVLQQLALVSVVERVLLLGM
jgi:hypothetical protein